MSLTSLFARPAGRDGVLLLSAAVVARTKPRKTKLPIKRGGRCLHSGSDTASQDDEDFDGESEAPLAPNSSGIRNAGKPAAAAGLRARASPIAPCRHDLGLRSVADERGYAPADPPVGAPSHPVVNRSSTRVRIPSARSARTWTQPARLPAPESAREHAAPAGFVRVEEYVTTSVRVPNPCARGDAAVSRRARGESPSMGRSTTLVRVGIQPGGARARKARGPRGVLGDVSAAWRPEKLPLFKRVSSRRSACSPPPTRSDRHVPGDTASSCRLSPSHHATRSRR